LILKQEGLSKKKKTRTLIEFAKSLTEITLTLLNTPSKVEPPRGNTVDPEKEKQAVFRSAGGQRKMIK